ncbi:MAG TPA: class I SAM-dependent methyltransferase, partial [Acidimicrobiia bacterium]|nr:class I SAM-dependent methyltransferase [Acidimicrobiia bacterium]
MAGQFHFDPGTYLPMVRAEVPDYDTVQEIVAQAADAVVAAEAILDLGTGTGETLRRVGVRHPHARLVGIDESAAMLTVARRVLPAAELRVARLQDDLPDGPFDLVVSALAVHHLDGAEKADLFRRVAARLRVGGRFILADVVIPDDPNDAV